MILKTLSVRAPWSWAIVIGLKPWENRKRPWRSYTGPLGIHASRCTRAYYEAAAREIERICGSRPPPFEAAEIGGLVGAVRLVGCADPLECDHGWRYAGAYGLELALGSNVRLPFRPMLGQLAPFDVEVTARERAILRAAGLT